VEQGGWVVAARSTLRLPAVGAVIDRVLALAAVEDELAKQRVAAAEAQLGHRLHQAQRYELYEDAPLAIKREVGELLYVLALGEPGRRVVEFGSSHGLSTIYLAAALRDSGGGTLITTECRPGKAETAKRNLADAGLSDLVEVRVGDALHTLSITGPVNLLFLDGRNDLYSQVLTLIEPHLSGNALIVADLSADDRDLLPYLEHVRDERNGYFSLELAVAAGVELSVWQARDR
jgi:predicted O-methyltransferase YrrM